MRIHVLALTIISLLVADSIGAQQTFSVPDRAPLRLSRYAEATAGDNITITAREWARDGGLLLQSESSAERHTILVDQRLHTVGWRYESPVQDTLVEARLTADGSVRLLGEVAGELVDEVIRLNDEPWIQSIERSFESLALSGSRGERLLFSVVQPDTLSARTLQAQVMGDETIEVDGVDVDVRRIRISLPGLGALFWRSDYWFRLSDGLFVKSDVTRGPPGTPATVVTLLEAD